MNNPMTRRTALRHLTTGAAAAITMATLPKRLRAEDAAPGLKGRINHSACRWCYAAIPLDDLCAAGKAMGLASIDLLQPEDFPTVQRHGLICAMVSNPTANAGGVTVGGITKAWNRREHHDALVPVYEAHLRAVAAAGFPNLICFSGNREGLADEAGLENCVVGLQRILPLAEKLGVTLCMELLNSKVNHHDYMCDHTAWGVELCRRLPSERFKLLYDIYHMQIMEGDVIDTIRANHEHIAHFHTGGVPGRHEIDDTQELFYPAVMRAIVATGFKGYVAQEFVPSRPDALAALRACVQICDV